MILHAIFISLLFLGGLALNRPMLEKPFSEDDGNWFYPAVFHDQGLKLEDFKWRYSFFGVHWLGIIARLLMGRSNASVFYGLKVLWYALTGVVIYLLAVIFWNEPLIGFLGGLFFLTATAVPATLFSLTYGEHFLNLPILAAMALFGLAGEANVFGFTMAAGLFMAWAFHIKPTALFAVVWLPIMAFLSPEPLTALLGYAAGFFLLNLLPVFYIGLRGGSPGKDLLLLFGSVLIMIRKVADRLKLAFVARQIQKLLTKHDQSEQLEIYIDRHQGLSWRNQWRGFTFNIKSAAIALRLMIILATAQVFLLFFHFDPFTLAILSLAVVYLLMQQVQKNYYTPHFNSVWAPLALLAAKTVHEALPVWQDNLPAAVLIAVVLAPEASRCVMAVRASFQGNRTAIFGARAPVLDILFPKCEEIGSFIREHSKTGDRLFVWGDQPSIYLYSQREIFNQDYLILYAHNNRIVLLKELIGDLWKSPPEFILFYNYKVNDGWNMERLQDAIGVKYDRLNTFQVADRALANQQNPAGVFFAAPLFRRNDEQYRWVLLERADSEFRKGAIGPSEAYLKILLEIFPDDFEASLMLKFLEFKSDSTNGKLNGLMRKYIENEIARRGDDGRQSVLLKKMGEIEADDGNFAEAHRYFSQALDRNPSDPFCWNSLGQLFLLGDSNDEAARCFQKTLDLNRYSAEALNNISVILAERGRMNDAENALKRAQVYTPNNPAVMENMRRLVGKTSI